MFQELEKHEREVLGEHYFHRDGMETTQEAINRLADLKRDQDWSRAVRLVTPYKAEPEPEPQIKLKDVSLRNDKRLEELLDEYIKNHLDKTEEPK